MGVFGGRLLILLRPEDEFRRGEDDGDHRARAGLPGAAGFFSFVKDTLIPLRFGDGGRTTEGPADKPINDELGPRRRRLAFDHGAQAPLQVRPRIKWAKQS